MKERRLKMEALKKGQLIRIRRAGSSDEWCPADVVLVSTNGASVGLRLHEAVRMPEGGIVVGGLAIVIDLERETAEGLFGEPYDIQVADIRAYGPGDGSDVASQEFAMMREFLARGQKIIIASLDPLAVGDEVIKGPNGQGAFISREATREEFHTHSSPQDQGANYFYEIDLREASIPPRRSRHDPLSHN
jgi:hypothetical protein